MYFKEIIEYLVLFEEVQDLFGVDVDYSINWQIWRLRPNTIEESTIFQKPIGVKNGLCPFRCPERNLNFFVSQVFLLSFEPSFWCSFSFCFTSFHPDLWYFIFCRSFLTVYVRSDLIIMHVLDTSYLLHKFTMENYPFA